MFILCISLNGYSQNNYSSSYKYVNLKNSKDINPNEQISQGFLESMVYTFFSNTEGCYLANVSAIETIGVNAKVSGEQNIFINYKNKDVFFNLKEPNCKVFKSVKFRLVEATSKVKVLGYATSKYLSEDNNLVIYTSKKLPWYVQPCLFNFNQINQSVLRFENLKQQYGLELIKIDKVLNNKDFDKNIKEIITKKCSHNREEIIAPFFIF